MQWGKIQYYNNSGGGRTPYSNKPRIYEVEGLTDHLSEFLRPQGRVQVDHIPILSSNTVYHGKKANLARP